METDVLIAGGGLAGLACAVALRGSGLRVTLLEASRELGGRARSWRDETTGDVVDIGPHIITTHHRNFLDLVEGCGTADQLVWQRHPLITLFDGERPVDARLAPLPAPFALLPTLFKARRVPWRARVSNAAPTQATLRLTEEDVLELDALTGEAYLRSLGVQPEFIDWFWRSMCMTLLNVPLERVSAGALMRCYAQLAGHRGYCFGFPAGGLGELFLPATRRMIEADGGGVLLDTPLAQLRFAGGRCVGGVTRDGGAVEARFVVCALPPAETAALLPAPVRESAGLPDLSRFEPSRYVSVYLWFDIELTRARFWTRIWSPDTLNYDFYALSNIRPALAGRGTLIASNIIHAQRLPPMADDEIVAVTLRELAQFAPAAATRRPRHARVHRIPLAVPCPDAGFESRRPRNELDGVPGLLLAGDWTRTALPASMESAVRSGRLAAEAIWRQCGTPRAIAMSPASTTGLAGILRRAHERRLARRSQKVA